MVVLPLVGRPAPVAGARAVVAFLEQIVGMAVCDAPKFLNNDDIVYAQVNYRNAAAGGATFVSVLCQRVSLVSGGSYVPDDSGPYVAIPDRNPFDISASLYRTDVVDALWRVIPRSELSSLSV